MTTVIRRPITPAARDPRWSSRALCNGIADPDLFFPSGASPEAKEQAEQARRICLACPVLTDCKDWALEVQERFGVVGGLTQEERRELLPEPARQRRALTPRPSPAMDRCQDAADIIRLWRAEGVTQKEMASRLGVGKGALGRWVQQYDQAMAQSGKKVAA
ncbi:WhiB family transcriptional regulator [Streptomyces hydrogenans]|uniref:WhiB family transcriptional regulator n=1 Tax=Streptomyces hydrogenans TaxID=1873719 RepID=UPI0036E68822